MFYKKLLFFSQTLEKVKFTVKKKLFIYYHQNHIFFFYAAKFVTVGWGSKETQFHGSEGKNARSKKDVQSTLASWDDKRARIVWRADGLFFAINAVDPNAGKFNFSIFFLFI